MHIHFFNVYSALFSKEGVLIWRIKDICGSDITESPKSSISPKSSVMDILDRKDSSLWGAFLCTAGYLDASCISLEVTIKKVSGLCQIYPLGGKDTTLRTTALKGTQVTFMGGVKSRGGSRLQIWGQGIWLLALGQ